MSVEFIRMIPVNLVFNFNDNTKVGTEAQGVSDGGHIGGKDLKKGLGETGETGKCQKVKLCSRSQSSPAFFSR